MQKYDHVCASADHTRPLPRPLFGAFRADWAGFDRSGRFRATENHGVGGGEIVVIVAVRRVGAHKSSFRCSLPAAAESQSPRWLQIGLVDRFLPAHQRNFRVWVMLHVE